MSQLFRDPYQDAADLGLQVVLPKEAELFLDIDSEEAEEHFRQMQMVLLSNGIEHRVVSNEPSRTEGHRHVVVQFSRALTPIERILLQATLGSDRKRELLSFLRIELETGFQPTVFFEQKAAA